MSGYLHNATKGGRVRIRQEDDENFLLYNAKTDELHIVNRIGKAIFEMCDGRSIDELVIEGAKLLQGEDGAAVDPEPYRANVLNYLCALRKRELIELT